VTNLEALGKRLVACKHFRAMRGMRDLQGRTWDEALLWRWSNEVDVPDLSDAATLGCVLALVREGYGDEGLGVVRQNVGSARGGARWFLIGEGGEQGGYYATESEALVAALEAAP
jgi:hypothetical protein